MFINFGFCFCCLYNAIFIQNTLLSDICTHKFISYIDMSKTLLFIRVGITFSVVHLSYKYLNVDINNPLPAISDDCTIPGLYQNYIVVYFTRL